MSHETWIYFMLRIVIESAFDKVYEPLKPLQNFVRLRDLSPLSPDCKT